MLTGTDLVNEIVDELNEIDLPAMSTALDNLYHKPNFIEMDRLTLIAEIIGPQYQEKVNKALKRHLSAAKLTECSEELSECQDSDQREYLPEGIIPILSSLDFIVHGYNLCILGESDAGKSYLAKALAIKACHNYYVGYFHCSEFLESMVALKEEAYGKYERKRLKRRDHIIIQSLHTHIFQYSLHYLHL